MFQTLSKAYSYNPGYRAIATEKYPSIILLWTAEQVGRPFFDKGYS
jgi:hypothetical protein